jgi:hypothetical protein
MTNNLHSRDSGILTIATGRQEYKDMAVSLAISLRRFSPTLPLAVVTDDDSLNDFFDVIIPVDWSRGRGVLQKLYIDQYSPFRCTLFIDCDCIVFRDVSYAFDVFFGGHSIITSDVYELSARKPRELNFEKMQQKVGQSWLHGFNGGAYYVEKGTTSQQVFELARTIATEFQEFGIPAFRDGEPNDEYVLAASMAALRVSVAPCWDQLLQIPLGLEGKFNIDVVDGKADFEIYGRNCRPSIVHFCGYFRDWPEYKRECQKLRALHFHRGSRLHARIASLIFRCKLLLSRLYPYLPRPIRLFFHALTKRLLTKTNPLKSDRKRG